MRYDPVWRLESPRNAERHLRSHERENILVDPTAVAAACFCPRLRTDLTNLLNSSQLVGLGSLSSDWTRLLSHMHQSKLISLKAARACICLLESLPIRTVPIRPDRIFERVRHTDLDARTATYLEAAKETRAAVLTMDTKTIAACRRSHIPRFIYNGPHQYAWKIGRGR